MAASLSERDQRICADLNEHRVLTTFQLLELHIPSYVRAKETRSPNSGQSYQRIVAL